MYARFSCLSLGLCVMVGMAAYVLSSHPAERYSAAVAGALEGLSPPASAQIEPHAHQSASRSDSLLPVFVYVGTNTGDRDEGIYTFRFNPSMERGLVRVGEVEEMLNPSFLALSPDARFLYAISESAEEGVVRAYQVNAESGALTILNEQSTAGAGPAHVSTDRTGRWVLVANYVGGSVALLPAGEDGRLEAATDTIAYEGSGPNEDRQDAPHAHYIHVDPSNRHAYATDLGTDRVHIYALDTEAGELAPIEASPVETAPGAGPRHLDVHPNGRYAYLVNELDGTVTAYARDAATGALSPLQTRSALPDGFTGHNQSADIHVHPNGRWLYVSNRGDYDSIALFAIDEATGHLALVGHETQGIVWPRHFAIDPTGRYLIVANRRANEIVAFSLDPDTGQLAPTGHRARVPEPTNITFLAPTG